MAGNTSSLPIEDDQTTHSEGLSFTFNFEGDYPYLVDQPNIYSERFYSGVSGNIEFMGQRRFAYWRSLVSVCLLLAVLSFGVFYLTGFSKNSLATKLSKPAEPEKEVLQIDETPEVPVEKIVLEPVLDELDEPEAIKKEEKNPDLEIIENTAIITAPEVLEKAIAAPPTQREIPISIEKEKLKDFKTNSLALAKDLSSSTGRYVFIKFGAAWCVPCQLMESTALKDEKVVSLLNSKFVVLNVDVDAPAGRKIKEEFYVDKLPTLIILDELGNQMRRKESALGTSGLTEMLESVAQYIYLEEEELTAAAYEEGFGGKE